MRRRVWMLALVVSIALTGLGAGVADELESPEGIFNGMTTHLIEGSSKIINEDGEAEHYVIVNGDGTHAIHEKDGPWKKFSGTGCNADFTTYARFECRPNDEDELYWTVVTYDEYTCSDEPKLRRIVIATRLTDKKCKAEEYHYWKKAVRQAYGEKWNPTIEPPPPPPPPPPPKEDDIYPPVGKFEPIFINWSLGKCPDMVIWKDEEGHQYVAFYDEHGVGKWGTAGPTEQPPPLPHEVAGRKVPECLPETDMIPAPPAGDHHETLPPGNDAVSPGAGGKPFPKEPLPVPKGPFVMPQLPDCFLTDEERQAFDDKVYELFLEQISASSLAPTPEAREEARRNVDALAELRSKMVQVPYCPAKGDKSHASNPDVLKDIFGHVTIGVGVGGGGHHDDHHNQHGTQPDNQPATKPGD